MSGFMPLPIEDLSGVTQGPAAGMGAYSAPCCQLLIINYGWKAVVGKYTPETDDA